MKLPRRTFLKVAGAAATAPVFSRVATGQVYPSRPITMIVSFPAGGGQDAVARLLAERFRGLLGQPVIVENISGADGSIATGRAARARPDGYTIDLGSIGTHVPRHGSKKERCGGRRRLHGVPEGRIDDLRWRKNVQGRAAQCEPLGRDADVM